MQVTDPTMEKDKSHDSPAEAARKSMKGLAGLKIRLSSFPVLSRRESFISFAIMLGFLTAVALAVSLSSRTFAQNTTKCNASPPTDAPSYTASITVSPQPGGTSAPIVGQPGWDDSLLNQTNTEAVHLDVSTTGGNKSSPLLYGLILEDLDHCIDGGLYAELIQNRAFQDGTLDAWYGLNDTCIALTQAEPLSSALPNALRISFQEGVAFANEGWWGFSVREVAYRISFWARTTTSTNFTVKAAFVSASDTSKEWASSTFMLTGGSGWTYYEASVTPSTAADDTNNLFIVTSTSSQEETVYFNLISVFPPTHNNRTNGVRADLMQNLIDLNLKHCRVPGGNNLEGQTVSTRWKWNETIGALTDRPGRQGDWGYYNTDGMGLYEWLQFCEDLGGETLLGLYAGYSLQGESVTEDTLQPYIDEVLNELEYVLGSSISTYGALRAKDGREEPFDVKYIEIGNEDFFSSTYDYRWPAFYDALKAVYPNITFVATTSKGITIPTGVQFDQHYYGDSDNFLGLFNAWDNWNRSKDIPILVGEYSVQRFDNQTFSPFPFQQGSVAEAVMGLGIERNSDADAGGVVGQMYAPFLSNLHWNREGKPRLISFDVDPSQTILSTSYHVLQLLSTTHPANSQNLPVTANVSFHPLYWAASLDEDTGTVYVKVANTGEDEQTVSTNLTCSNGTVVSGEQLDRNTPTSPETVGPKVLDISGGNGTAVTLPGLSVAVLVCGST